MANGYENWVWLDFTHYQEVAKAVPTVVAVEGVCLRKRIVVLNRGS